MLKNKSKFPVKTDSDDDPIKTYIIISLKEIVLFNFYKADKEKIIGVPKPMLIYKFCNSKPFSFTNKDFGNENVA